MQIKQAYIPIEKESIWKYQDFTLLLFAALLLSIGSKIYELLLPLIMYDLSESTMVMTSMRTAELLPNFFFGILIGVIVDRVNKKVWAIAMVISQAFVLVMMYILFEAQFYSPMAYYMLGFILMTLNYGFFNTQVSLIKLTLPTHLLTSGNARFSFIETFVGIMGPVFLGVVLMLMGKNEGLLLAAILYSIAYLLLQKLSGYEPQERKIKTSFWQELREGWSGFTQNKALKTMTIFIIFLNCTMSVVSMTVLIFGTVDLGLSSSMLSIMLSAAGVGGLVGSLTINALRRTYKLGMIFGLSILLNAAAYLGLYLSDTSFLFIFSLFINGYATTSYMICSYTFRHEQTPSHLIGRISGITGTLYRTGMPVAMLLSGWLISHWGTSFVFISSCVLNIILYLFYHRSFLRSIK